MPRTSEIAPSFFSSPFAGVLLTSSEMNPAEAAATSDASSSETPPKVRKVESRIWSSLNVKEPSAEGVTLPNLMRAMPPRVSFSRAPSWMTCLSTSR